MFYKENSDKPCIFSEYKLAPWGKLIKVRKYMTNRNGMVTGKDIHLLAYKEDSKRSTVLNRGNSKIV